MGLSIRITTKRELQELRSRLDRAHEHARTALRGLLDAHDFMERIKFERLGCDPLDVGDAQNLAEQIDQQATYEAAAQALTLLFARHPGLSWDFAPGAHGSGHDIASTDGKVVAEVFASVDPANNRKLSRDLAKVKKAETSRRYVFFRSPAVAPSEREVDGVTVIALPPRAR